ncbi:MAG: tetratricopeptide repeat protein [Magnetococcales bacterium]|nr:tetratricopeptide repeat protein [Magnetococcales bacterium]
MKIIAFFSFKGGVGRTSLMMNLATYWASLGKVIGLVDMDLAAPGLTYSPMLKNSPWSDPSLEGRGFSDLLTIFYEKHKENPDHFGYYPAGRLFREMFPPKGMVWGRNGRIMAMGAGKVRFQSPTIIDGEIQTIPSSNGASKNPFDKALRGFSFKLREDFSQFVLPDCKKKFDYVLIDCRTGFPELLNMTLGYLADEIVLISGLNEQNLTGLSLTLKALRKERVPLGCYAKDLKVVFSPIPAHIHDDPFAMQALNQGKQLLKDERLHVSEGEQDEVVPVIYTLPYTPHLAVSDLPLALKNREHPYVQSVINIAEDIDGQLLEKQEREIQEKISRTTGISADRKPDSQKSKKSDNQQREHFLLDDSLPKKHRSEDFIPLLRLPHWYWPLDLMPEEGRTIDSVREELIGSKPMPEGVKVSHDEFLDWLSGFTSMSWENKKQLLDDFDTLSAAQINELVGVFNEERQKLSMLDGEFIPNLISHYFKHQKEWVEHIVLNEDNSIVPALLKGFEKGNHPFPAWEQWGQYWYELWQEAGKNTELRELIYQGVESVEEDVLSIWGRVGDSFGEQGECPEAERCYKKAADIDPEDARVCAALGDLYHNCMENYKNAELYYNKAIERDSKFADPWYGLGNLYQYNMGRYEDSESSYRKAIDLDSKFAGSWYELGNLYQYNMGRYEDSESSYRKAIELEPKVAISWNELGNLYQYHMERYEESESSYRKAIELDPKYAPPWHGLGNLYQNHMERYEDSESSYRKAIELDPKLAHPWQELGNLYQNYMDRYEDSESSYRKAIDLDPKFAHAWNGLGLLSYYRNGYFSIAKSVFKKGLTVSEDEAGRAYIHRNLGSLYQHLNETDLAREHFEKSLLIMQQGKGVSEFVNQTILTLALEKQFDEIVELSETWLRRKTKDVAVQFIDWLIKISNSSGQTEATDFQSIVNRVSNHEERLDIINDGYLLAGCRSDLREPLRQLVTALCTLPQEKRDTFKDVPKPQKMLDRYKPFIEGKSYGCGDPKDLPLFWNKEEPPFEMPG